MGAAMSATLAVYAFFLQVDAIQSFETTSIDAMKSYGQRCPVSRALDVVGDRWALLVLRELELGPKRYTDLLDGLPGVGTNVLSARLRDLEAAGVIVKRTLPPPTPVTV